HHVDVAVGTSVVPAVLLEGAHKVHRVGRVRRDEWLDLGAGVVAAAQRRLLSNELLAGGRAGRQRAVWDPDDCTPGEPGPEHSGGTPDCRDRSCRKRCEPPGRGPPGTGSHNNLLPLNERLESVGNPIEPALRYPGIMGWGPGCVKWRCS